MDIKALERFEGRVPHWYLDTEGYPTIGVGCMFRTYDDVLTLPYEAWDKPECVRSDFEAVLRMPKGLRADLYARACQARLKEKVIDELRDVRVAQILNRLRRIVPWYDTFFPSGRNGLGDMAFNLGGDFLNLKRADDTSRYVWAKFRHAVAQPRPDWTTAAEQCRRTGIGAERNEWTKQQFLSAAKEAA